MDYLLFNSDGSINQSDLHQYVQEGDNNKKVLVKVEGLETGTELAQAICRLPNGQVVALTGVWNAIQLGWIFTFSESVTHYPGVVLVAIRVVDNNIIKVTFPFSLVVNETGLENPNIETGISLEELDAYLNTIKSWIDTTQSIEFPIEDGQWEGFIQSLQTETPRIGFLTEEQKAIIKNYNIIQLTIPANVSPYLGLTGEHKFKMLKRDAFSGSGENENYIMFDIFHDNGVIISFGFREDVNALYLNDMFNININIQNGTGTNAVRQKMADATVNFAGRNANAEALDPSISTTINTGASGSQSFAAGKNTMALATASFANGNKTIAKGEESHAEGYQSVTLGDGSHAEGAQTVASGLQSHSEGALTQALGDESHAEGHGTIAGALASHSEGSGTKVGDYSQESGIGADQNGGGGGSSTPPSDPYNAEYGEGSHSEGYNNVVKGWGSHAEGVRNYLTGNYAHVEGTNNTNSGDYSYVSGFNNINTGQCSYVVGVWNNATRYGSFTAGYSNENKINDYKAVFGVFNNDKQNTLFEVGNGTSDSARSNAFEVYQDGHAEVGLMGAANKSVANKEYVDNKVRLWKHTIYLTQPASFRLNVIDKTEESISNLLQIQGRTLDAISHKLINGNNNMIMQLIGFPVVNLQVNIKYIDENGVVQITPCTINYDLVTNY